ncbi:elongin-A-like [Dendronephthya gigantea]|uniref:elongin-A-like n=1 Tax=Dendronephthya gigantea TaxID=151771 RepID=UPI00106C07E6|nr:elongin-A-like [Dendronephthya gigantea]
MDGGEATIMKVKKKLDSDSLDEDKILKYLRALDEIVIGFEILKSTGIGKSVNNLRKRGGSIALLSKALVKKWKSLVPVENCSPLKKGSPLNTLQSDFKTEHCNVTTTPTKHSQNSPKKEMKVKQKEKLVKDDKRSDHHENKSVKKQKTGTMQLCDLGFVSETRVSSPKKKLKTKHSELMLAKPASPTLPSAEEIGASLLPDIQPNYIPQRFPDYLDDSSPRKRKAVSTDIPADLLSSRKSRTQVFSGRRTANRSGVVVSLHEICIKILIENVEALFDTGGVPFDILEPVLAKCSPAQLWNLEEYNPYFTEDTGPLWKVHCQRDFKETSTMKHDDWRALYLEKHEGREKKLKSIDAKIKASQAAKQQVRQVKLAYVHTQAKAPPQVRRRQVKHGTGRGFVIAPPSIIRPARVSSTSSSTSAMTSSSRVPIVSARKPKQTTLMKKVKQMGSMHRSRANSSIIRR